MKYYGLIRKQPGYIIPEQYNASEELKWEQPIPFEENVLPTFPVEALPARVRPYVEAVADTTQTPVDMVRTAVLSAMASCIQGKYLVNAKDDWTDPTNIYAIMVAEPSERKSTVTSLIVKPINLYEMEYNKQHSAALEKKAILKKYADDNGFTNTSFFVDDGYSGTTFERPDWQRLMEQVDEGKVGTIIVKDMSRLGRDYLKVGMYTEMIFPNADIRFIAINNGVDSNNQMDNDMTPFINIFNEFYAKDTSRKIRAVFKAKGQAGKPLCTNPPYGYIKDPEDKLHWIIDEEAAEIVKEIFHLCVQDYGVSQIATAITSRHIMNPTAHAKANGINPPDNRKDAGEYY